MKNPSTDGADTFNVQTMLNENWQKIDNNAGTVAQTLANILKPTTPPIIGLPPSTTPDGMFRALGNTGELHVWRKTVTTAQEIPAGYTLGALETVTFKKGGTSTLYFSYGASIGVSDDGKTVYIKNASNGSWYGSDIVSGSSVMKGKFIQLYGDSAISNLDTQPVYFFPESSTMECDAMSGKIYANVQFVTGYPLTPAGTTTTYPVSTNPNAYQEGDDAKEAGYVLGDVEMGNFKMGVSLYVATNDFYYVDTPNVSDDGVVVSVPTENTSKISVGYKTDFDASTLNVLRGKFVMRIGDAHCDAIFYSVIYIPADATFTKSDWGDDGYTYYLNKYQPVTGYAAIPAGTTIEYLGKLGDKARVQVVSYVGTGTYGEDNPNSLTFDNLPEAIIFLGNVDSSGSVYNFIYTKEETRVLYPKIIPNGRNYVNGYGFGYGIYGKRDGNTISWYSTQNQDCQANRNGYTFYYLVLS